MPKFDYLEKFEEIRQMTILILQPANTTTHRLRAARHLGKCSKCTRYGRARRGLQGHFSRLTLFLRPTLFS